MPARRLLSFMIPTGTLLTAIVECPGTDSEGVFQRGFTVSGSQLWLLESGAYSVYQQRAP